MDANADKYDGRLVRSIFDRASQNQGRSGFAMAILDHLSNPPADGWELMISRFAARVSIARWLIDGGEVHLLAGLFLDCYKPIYAHGVAVAAIKSAMEWPGTLDPTPVKHEIHNCMFDESAQIADDAIAIFRMKGWGSESLWAEIEKREKCR